MSMIAAAVLCLWVSSPGADLTPATQLEGLTATLRADPVTVPMGDAVHFTVTLAFDSTIAATNTRILNQFSSRCEFIFVNKKTGKSFGRSPYDTGMPRMEQPGNLAELEHGESLKLEDVTVHLLSEKGEQIPAGEYAVRAIYENDGGGKVEAYLDSTRQYRQRVYGGRWKLWTGKIESLPCAIRISPASETTVEVAVPKTLVVDSSRVPGQIGWSCNATSEIRVHKCRCHCGLGVPTGRGSRFVRHVFLASGCIGSSAGGQRCGANPSYGGI
jgi:hypothetical protein